ncbi:MAG: hypothetical protein JW716_04940 [Candidatus Aenigmarchaeota archaeon]|nr:hypothetical protein [Candidatus Aenigmarchaeota archaeon]
MRGIVKKSASVILIVMVIALFYSLYSFIRIESGDGMAGYLTKEDRLFSVDYTSCKNGDVVATLRNLDGVDVRTADDVEVIRENDGKRVNWNIVIPPGDTGTFSDECRTDGYSVPCRYTVKSKKYGLITRISVLCS